MKKASKKSHAPKDNSVPKDSSASTVNSSSQGSSSSKAAGSSKAASSSQPTRKEVKFICQVCNKSFTVPDPMTRGAAMILVDHLYLDDKVQTRDYVPYFKKASR